MLTLLAFALGLSVSIALERFNTRSDIVIQEANTIGTAWRDATAIGGPVAALGAKLLETYARVRLDDTTPRWDPAAERALLAHTRALQSEIWQLVTPLVRGSPSP